MEGRISKRNTETSSKLPFRPNSPPILLSASPVALVKHMNIPFVDFEFLGFTATLVIIAGPDSLTAPAHQVADIGSPAVPLIASWGFSGRDRYTRRVLVPAQGKFLPGEMEA